MVELIQLKYFVKLAEVLNFTEAARQLFITQSTLSQSIAKMEKELGIRLFDRIGHKLYLNEAGEIFLTNALQTISSANEGIQKLRDMQEVCICQLHIGVTYSLCPALIIGLSQFSEKYPNVNVRVSYFSSINEVVNDVKDKKLDFAIAYRPSIVDVPIEVEELFHSPLCAIVGKNHPLCEYKEISLSDLARYPLVIPSQGLQTRSLIDNLLNREKVNLKANIELNEISMITQLLRYGNWVSILTENSITDNDSLLSIPFKERSVIMHASIIWPKGAYTKKMARKFADLLLKRT